MKKFWMKALGMLAASALLFAFSASEVKADDTGKMSAQEIYDVLQTYSYDLFGMSADDFINRLGEVIDTEKIDEALEELDKVIYTDDIIKDEDVDSLKNGLDVIKGALEGVSDNDISAAAEGASAVLNELAELSKINVSVDEDTIYIKDTQLTSKDVDSVKVGDDGTITIKLAKGQKSVSGNKYGIPDDVLEEIKADLIAEVKDELIAEIKAEFENESLEAEEAEAEEAEAEEAETEEAEAEEAEAEETETEEAETEAGNDAPGEDDKASLEATDDNYGPGDEELAALMEEALDDKELQDAIDEVVKEAEKAEKKDDEKPKKKDDEKPKKKDDPKPADLPKKLSASASQIEELKALDAGLGYTAYMVQDGDSLWSIAKELYGDGSRFAALYSVNEDLIDDAQIIRPGQILTLP